MVFKGFLDFLVVFLDFERVLVLFSRVGKAVEGQRFEHFSRRFFAWRFRLDFSLFWWKFSEILEDLIWFKGDPGKEKTSLLSCASQFFVCLILNPPLPPQKKTSKNRKKKPTKTQKPDPPYGKSLRFWGKGLGPSIPF